MLKPRRPNHLLEMEQKPATRTNWTDHLKQKTGCSAFGSVLATPEPTRTNWTTIKEFKVINNKSKKVVRPVGRIRRVEIQSQAESSCFKKAYNLDIPLNRGYGGFNNRHQPLPLISSGVVFLWYVKAGLGTKPNPYLRFKRDLNQTLRSKTCILKKPCVFNILRGAGTPPPMSPRFFFFGY